MRFMGMPQQVHETITRARYERTSHQHSKTAVDPRALRSEAARHVRAMGLAGAVRCSSTVVGAKARLKLGL